MFALKVCCLSLANGLAVFNSTVPATPPSNNDALGDLYTAAELINSDGYWSNSIERLPLVETCSLPLSVEKTKSPDKPRMLISAACPPVLTADIPGKRVNASAIDTSGNPPKSSAEICSDTVSLNLFWLSDLIRLDLKPTTSIFSMFSSARSSDWFSWELSGFCCAWRGKLPIIIPLATKATVIKLGLNLVIFVSHYCWVWRFHAYQTLRSVAQVRLFILNRMLHFCEFIHHYVHTYS